MSYPNMRGGYQTTPSGGNPRQTEAWALTEAARRMLDAKTRGPGDELLGAVRLNWRLWTIFQAELSSPECPLPDDIRSNMLSLANFVDKTTVDLIADPQPQKLDILITINRNIAAGLFTNPEEASPPAPGAAAGLSDLSA
ncbi:MAG: flagellar biosynthesis regulator FlaF [Solirubrobacterales bacterium]